MTPEAQRFKEANDKCPVVSGRVIYRKGHTEQPGNVWGGSYRLANGQTFKLPSDELRTLPEGYPKWEL